MSQIQPYRFRALSSHRHQDADPNALFMLAQISRVAITPIRDLAALARDILLVHPQVPSIDRIAIVQRHGLANQIEVISCATEIAPNLMDLGYSCYVDANGSLFQTPELGCRVYESAESVIRKSQDMQKSPQRSISYVRDMKLSSGLCLPLGTSVGTFGYLFINSKASPLDRLLESPFSVILSNLVNALALRISAQAHPTRSYRTIAQKSPALFQGAPLNSIMVTKALAALNPQSSESITIDVARDCIESTLVSHGNHAYMLSSAQNISSQKLIVNYSKQENVLMMEVRCPQAMAADIEWAWSQQCSFLLPKSHRTAQGICLHFNWETYDAAQPETLYSTPSKEFTQNAPLAAETQKDHEEPPSVATHKSSAAALVTESRLQRSQLDHFAPEQLCQVIYSSVATKDFDGSQCQDLLQVCQKNNQIKGLSGFLIWHGGLFLQLIEGSASALRDLLTKIEGDLRHSSVNYLEIRECSERAFGEWSMAYRESDHLDFAIINQMLQLVRMDPLERQEKIQEIFTHIKESLAAK